jgi:hypothetical protein
MLPHEERMREGYWFTPEHADETQRQHFINRCILHSSMSAVAEFNKISIGIPNNHLKIMEIASQLVSDIDPCEQTMENLTAWFNDNQ